jgi:predicted SAM-dependent methyltransferase
VDFSHTKLRLNRHPLDYAKVQRVVSALIRNRHAFADIKKPGTYLDIGCGRNTHADFCNLDYDWHPGIDVCWDITRRLPFPDHYICGVFTEHCLEHFSLDTGLAMLGEIHRILRPRGVLRVVVPDGELYLRNYASNIALPYAEGDAKTHPIATPMVSVNRIFRRHGHLFIWDFETLAAALLKLGFRDVTKAAFGEGRDGKLLIDTPSRKIESLYVECVA